MGSYQNVKIDLARKPWPETSVKGQGWAPLLARTDAKLIRAMGHDKATRGPPRALLSPPAPSPETEPGDFAAGRTPERPPGRRSTCWERSRVGGPGLEPPPREGPRNLSTGTRHHCPCGLSSAWTQEERESENTNTQTSKWESLGTSSSRLHHLSKNLTRVGKWAEIRPALTVSREGASRPERQFRKEGLSAIVWRKAENEGAGERQSCILATHRAPRPFRKIL